MWGRQPPVGFPAPRSSGLLGVYSDLRENTKCSVGLGPFGVLLVQTERRVYAPALLCGALEREGFRPVSFASGVVFELHFATDNIGEVSTYFARARAREATHRPHRCVSAPRTAGARADGPQLGGVGAGRQAGA